ncbi:hypothetical protein PgNI_05141 [Pyricularia grisea]|uniref:Fatty acid synthase meander beta sheet domain-containing protein n=1 Tax=Pyricularia grisea TaxID=148305 RepID=A0A6P8B7Y6_PYRGI|nr:hypothetical protein PgNI_05141 [Pyricularia grisea]TLD11358.1 hypothetical protein PgNI_05141 [Pyricularia grisea]
MAPFSSRSTSPEQDAVLLEIKRPIFSNKISASLYLYAAKLSVGVPVNFRLKYHSKTPYSLVHEEEDSRGEELYCVYQELWLDGAKVELEADLWFSQSVKANEERVRAFDKAVG